MKRAKSRIKRDWLGKTTTGQAAPFINWDVRFYELNNKRRERNALITGFILGLICATGISLYSNNAYLRDFVSNSNPINQCTENLCRETLGMSTESAQSDNNGESVRLRAKTLTLIERHPDFVATLSSHFGTEWRKWAELIARESSFNPQAVNPSSGACGLGQALPCEKMGCELSDVNCQLAWVENYVTNRYGDIDKTLAHHDRTNWY
jgi:hypothetical protein